MGKQGTGDWIVTCIETNWRKIQHADSLNKKRNYRVYSVSLQKPIQAKVPTNKHEKSKVNIYTKEPLSNLWSLRKNTKLS